MEKENAVNEDAQTKDLAYKHGDDADELLKKISEVVKDDSSPTKAKEDISKCSEKDFLKKNELESENSEGSILLKEKSATIATSSENVVVGELVMDINVDLNTKKNIDKNSNSNVLDIITKKFNNSLVEDEKKPEENKVSPVNIGSHLKSNIKNGKERTEEIEKNKNSVSKNIEIISMDTSDFSNNIEQMEIDSAEKSDMEVEDPDPSAKIDTAEKDSLEEKDILKLSTSAKIEVPGTHIEKTLNEVLIKENPKNILDTEKQIKLGDKLQNATDTIQANNEEIKKNELTENGESINDVTVQSSDKSAKEGIHTADNSTIINKSDGDKSPNKVNIEYENTKVSDIEIGKKSEAQNKIIFDLKKEELKSNLNCTPVSTPTVFNSTPILKQFEISSENVSKISEAETSQIQNSVEEKFEKPKIKDCTTETDTDCGTCTTSESDHKTSDGINKFVEICKNGIHDTTPDDEDEKSAKYLKTSEANVKIELPSCSSNLETKLDGSYQVNFLPEDNDIRYFYVEKVEAKTSSSISSDQSSYGSVSSMTPFTLPTKSVSNLSEISSTTSTSRSQTTFVAPIQSYKNITHAFKNKIDLCTFVIDHFTKIKNKIETVTSKNLNINAIKTNINKRDAIVSPPSVTGDKRSRKRSLNITQNEGENEDMLKSKQDTPITKNDIDNKYGECVLAKWVDKKYYAGRISDEKPGNKFVVLFEDGASKILLKDAIVFGEDRVLPLKDQSVYALVDDDDFERGVVVAIEKLDDKVYYTVKTDNKTVRITSSDIYLQESQAKIIQQAAVTNKLKTGETSNEHQMDSGPNNGRSTRNKRLLASPVTPEAGFSGSGKGNKRQKRYS